MIFALGINTICFKMDFCLYFTSRQATLLYSSTIPQGCYNQNSGPIGAMSSASSLKMWQGSSTGPPALDGSTSRRSFATPFSHIFRLATGGMLGPSSTVSACASSVVKTEENWWFNMSALDWLSECSLPLRLSGDTPQLSWRCDFTYRQKGFELPVSTLSLSIPPM